MFVGEEVFQDDQGEYYFVSTENPSAKWDWWVVGGCYRGFFQLAGAVPADLPEELECDGLVGGTANGAPKRFLNLEGMRSEAAERAGREWDAFDVLRSQYPQGQGWSAFCARHRADPTGYPMARARADYGDQPLIRACRESPMRYRGCPIDAYGSDRRSHARRAHDHGVLGYALLTSEGEWIAPGEMGWFASSDDDQDDRDAYARKANSYINDLSGDTYLIAVDCHI